MRSLAPLRLTAVACGTTALISAAAHLTNLSLDIPVYQLRLAWTLARVLLQL
jgi:hypothetical protein